MAPRKTSRTVESRTRPPTPAMVQSLLSLEGSCCVSGEEACWRPEAPAARRATAAATTVWNKRT